MADSFLNKITTHVADAKARLSGQYKEKPLIEGTIGIIAKQVQDLENLFFDIIDAEVLSSAEGAFLDNLGELVVQPREGLGDAFYRIVIAVKIVKNFSKGEPASIIRAARLIFSTSSVHYMNLGGGNVGLHVTGGTTPPVPSSFIYESLTEVAAAGVKIVFITVSPPDTDDSDMFAYDGSGPGKGFGSLTDPNAGGKLAGLL